MREERRMACMMGFLVLVRRSSELQNGVIVSIILALPAWILFILYIDV